jgi:hypothetical protein
VEEREVAVVGRRGEMALGRGEVVTGGRRIWPGGEGLPRAPPRMCHGGVGCRTLPICAIEGRVEGKGGGGGGEPGRGEVEAVGRQGERRRGREGRRWWWGEDGRGGAGRGKGTLGLRGGR